MSDQNPNAVPALSFTPSLAPNAIFLTIFVLLLPILCFVTYRYPRYYGWSIGTLCGTFLEMLGYVAKVQLSSDPAHKDAYILYLIGLTLGPTFLSSSLYLIIAELQRWYSPGCFRGISPTLFATLFILGDFICLCFIGVGGSLAAIFSDQPIGVNLMITGLAVQVAFTSIFAILVAVLYGDVRRHLVLRSESVYFGGVAIVCLCLFIRSAWRVAELSGGFNGPLASREDIFIALDSVPISVMSWGLAILHPAMWARRIEKSAEGYTVRW